MIRLARRAALDREFRDLCLADSSRAYLELSGEALPKEQEMRFVEPGAPAVTDGDRPVCPLPEYLPPTWLD